MQKKNAGKGSIFFLSVLLAFSLVVLIPKLELMLLLLLLFSCFLKYQNNVDRLNTPDCTI